MGYDARAEWAELEEKLPDVLAGRITDLQSLLGPVHIAHAIRFMVLIQETLLRERRARMAELKEAPER